MFRTLIYFKTTEEIHRTPTDHEALQSYDDV